MGAYRDMGTRGDGAVLALLGCLGRAPSAEQTPKVFSHGPLAPKSCLGIGWALRAAPSTAVL